jgi:hypothetical protein
MVIGNFLTRCRGLTTLWVQSGVNLPPPLVALVADERPAGWLRPALAAAVSWRTPPATPPPRSASVD